MNRGLFLNEIISWFIWLVNINYLFSLKLYVELLGYICLFDELNVIFNMYELINIMCIIYFFEVMYI